MVLLTARKSLLSQIRSYCVRAWFDKKLDFIKELGGLIIGKTDMSVAADQFSEWSKSESGLQRNLVRLVTP
jgi:hypothetical protein